MNKLTQEELNEISQLKQDFALVYSNLGELSAKIADLEEQLQMHKQEHRQYLNTHKVLVEKDKDLARVISAKYGNVRIDLETGEIIA